MCTGTLETLYPPPLWRDSAPGPISDHPAALFVQLLPVTATATLVTLLLALRPPPRALPHLPDRAFAYVVNALASAAYGVASWRFVELLDCEGIVEADAWLVLVVGAGSLFHAVALVVLARVPRLVAAAHIILASASAFGTVAVQGSLADAHASSPPLVALQQLSCLQALTALPFVKASRRTARGKAWFRSPTGVSETTLSVPAASLTGVGTTSTTGIVDVEQARRSSRDADDAFFWRWQLRGNATA